MLKDIFYELADDAEKIVTKPEGDAFLARVIKEYGLAHACYLGVNLPVRSEHGDFYVTTTYSKQWLLRYESAGYVGLDPIVRHGLQSIVPLDWSTVDRQPKRMRQFFGESTEFGVARQGLTIPIRGVHGETALFSVNSELSDAEWRSFRREFARDFQLLGYQFHEHVLRRENVAPSQLELTARQLEMLRWAASGKTEWETANICGISTNTVAYHLAGAITKLSAVNKTQAVAKAIRMRLI